MKRYERSLSCPAVAVAAVTLLALAMSACKAEVGEERSTEDSAPRSAQPSTRYAVTPVEGPSWLHQLRLPIGETRMGQVGGSQPAPNAADREPRTSSERGTLGAIMDRFLGHWLNGQDDSDTVLEETFHLRGVDLYRLNCQSCHGPSGEGAPPEINAILDPVRGASAALLMARMKDRGTPIDRQMADQLAEQAAQTIRQRLEQGGEKMPSFPHLRGDEIEALMTYLRHLAGAPGSAKDVELVPESAARVGEHVTKGTCHICHDATGPGGGHLAMMRGVIPSLASMPHQLSLSTVIRQVQYGSSSMMRGMMGGMMGGGVSSSSSSGRLMPAIPYLTEPEIAAAYFYLARYPPRP